MDSIIEKADLLITEHQLRNSRREMWTQQTKKVITSNLNAIKSNISFEWEVRSDDKRENLQSIFLAFNDMPSGIVEKNSEKEKNFFKKGGALCYTQQYNGLVLPYVVLPHIEEIIPESDLFDFKRMEPEDITSEVIYRHAEKFLDLISEWERKS